MNHSVETIREYVCQFYGATVEEILSSSIEYRLVRARQMIVLLSGTVRRSSTKGKDKYIAQAIGRYRCQIPVIRKTILGNMQYDKVIRAEYEKLRDGLMAFEISELMSA